MLLCCKYRDRWLSIVMVAWWSFAGTVSGREFEIPEKPNIVCILADDLGWADVGYNNPNVYSPHLDELVESSVLLTQHYVMPQCTPTRVALMTGRYPSRFGGAAMQASNRPAFPRGTPTLPMMLKQAGYRTYLAGKWHLGSRPEHGPNHFGFDSSYGSLAGAVGMYDHRYRPGDFEQTWHRDHQWIAGAENGKHVTDLVMEEALRVIEIEDPNPFFLYLPFHAVHTPLDERDEHTDYPTELDPRHAARWFNEGQNRWFNDPLGKIQKELDPEKRLLLAAVNHLDHAIGKIVDALDVAGKRDKTLILFSSDNGPQGSWGGNAYPDDLELTDFNQELPFRGMKLDVWEGGIHVPGFVHWRGVIEPRQLNAPTHIVDWLPTILAILGTQNGSHPQKLDGIDLTPTLLLGKQVGERDLYWNWHENTNRWALRAGKWKIVKYGNTAPTEPSDWELYNLESDAAETNNLAATFPKTRERLHERYLRHRSLDAP